MKYRRKSQVIEAFQWLIGPEHPPGPKWFGDAVKSGQIEYQYEGTPHVRLKAMYAHEGPRRVAYIAEPGDYLINYGNGDIRAKSKDFFEEAYERVEEKG